MSYASYARELVTEDKVANDLKEDTGTTGNWKKHTKEAGSEHSQSGFPK